MKILLILMIAISGLSMNTFAEEMPPLPPPPTADMVTDVPGSPAPSEPAKPEFLAPVEAPAPIVAPVAPEAPAAAPVEEPKKAEIVPEPPQAVPAAAPSGEMPAAPETPVIADDDFDPRTPRYQLMRPAWAFQVSGSPKALGAKDVDARQASQKYPARAFSFSSQYQPTFLQMIGVLSFGPTFSVYPVASGAALTKRPYAIWGVGGQIQYQLRLIRNQWIVPYAGYAAESVAYSFNGGKKGRSTMKGSYFGGYLNLNVLEPGAAADFFGNHGVLRSYLFGELRTQDLATPDFSIIGKSLYFGIRIEML